ncbi:double-strand break repair protein MRE11 [Vespa velutina]|uniref:double-strand break repair protein MRE11 n=1 Tax=Vespa velutina TaxID=202808 RepID=UPI001FB2BF75|nr:double-strand break repair protein MRE11 [Vespa velutina]
MAEISDSDTFKILIATDIHLGYQHERNKGQLLYDSFTTFEEILQYGKKYKVDFILLGGDLFHDTKPSQTTMVECMDLIRKYCYGPGDIAMEFLTDPSTVFEHCRYKNANYEDPNININMPIFTIHGNHDDPSFSSVGSMDTLSVAGLVNYFGKWMSLDKLTVEPIILRKGSTLITLYGLGYVNDQRLYRLIKDDKLQLKEVEEFPECFNILVLHQNRVQHAQNDYVPESKLPPFLNLVIWGHEHECRITPETVTGVPYFITQPGSSIATSLCQNESISKHVGLLYVNKLQFKIKKLKLNTVRPFVFDTLILYNNPEIEEKRKTQPTSSNASIISEYVDKYIEHKLIPKAIGQLTGHHKQPKEPLIRLRLFYNDEQDVFETTGLSQKYCDEVLNPMSMILFRKTADTSKSSKHSIMNDSLDDLVDKFHFEDEERGWTQSVQGSIKEYFDSEENKDLLTILSVTGLNETLSQYIIKADEEAIQDVIQSKINKTKEHLKKQRLEKPEEILDKIKEYRDERNKKEEEESRDVINFLSTRLSKKKRAHYNNDDDDDDDDDHSTDNNDGNDSDDNIDDDNEISYLGRGRGKQNTITRGKGRGRASSKVTLEKGSRGAKVNMTNKNNKDSFTSSVILNKGKRSVQQMQPTINQHSTTFLSQLRRPAANTYIDVSDSD